MIHLLIDYLLTVEPAPVTGGQDAQPPAYEEQDVLHHANRQISLVSMTPTMTLQTSTAAHVVSAVNENHSDYGSVATKHARDFHVEV